MMPNQKNIMLRFSFIILVMVLIGIDENDTDKDLDYICDKLTGLRIFEDTGKT